MCNYHHRWENYIRVLEKRATDHPIQWVVATIVFSFVAGFNTLFALFSGHLPRHFSVVVVIYVVLTSYNLCCDVRRYPSQSSSSPAEST